MNRRLYGPEQLTLPAPDPGLAELSSAFLKPVARILDVGSGNGRNAIHLAKNGHAVIGIDKDPTMVEEARTWASALGSVALHISFRVGDMLELPFTIPSFEAVFATRSLQELRDRRQAHKAITNMQQATLPDGYNFITAYVGTRRQQFSKPHLTILNPGELEERYAEDGWNVIHTHSDIKSPLALETGETLLRSYDEIVAQKPV